MAWNLIYDGLLEIAVREQFCRTNTNSRDTAMSLKFAAGFFPGNDLMKGMQAGNLYELLGL